MYHAPWLLVIALYTPIFFQLYQSRWETIDYTHAYFVLPVSLWLAWRKRADLKTHCTLARSSFWDILFLGLIVTGLLMFIFGWRLDFLVLPSLSLIPVILGLTGYLYGANFAKVLIFPIAYLLFLVPPPLGVLDALTMPMRYGISSAAEVILRMLDYPIQRTGLLMTMAGKEIFMGAPCSGFRSLITMFALSSAYLHIAKGGAAKKGILLASVIPLTMVGNLIRVMTLCLITHYAGEKAAQGFLHELSGSVIFLLSIGCFMLIENAVDRAQIERAPEYAF